MSPEPGAISRLQMTLLPARDRWEQALIATPPAPLPEAFCRPITLFMQALAEVLIDEYKLHHLLALQVWKVGPDTGSATISEHGAEWKLQLGLGIWPNRRPPQGWTEEMMMDAAADVITGDEPELPAYRLLRMRLPPKDLTAPAAALRPFGVIMQCFSKLGNEGVLERGQEVLTRKVKEPRFLNEDFYLPLLDTATVKQAESEAQIDEWLCGIDVYVRESAEDKAIFILSRLPLRQILEAVQSRLATNQEAGGHLES